jgi:hypothetical protein
MTSYKKIFTISAVLLLVGCVTPALVGTREGDIPPQLVKSGVKGPDGVEFLTWDRPLSFGPVPESLKVSGDIACMFTGLQFEAIGYHTKARDASGNAMPSGGYFCAQKIRGTEPAPEAPRLVRKDGILGWDRPGLFGAIPNELRERGEKVCAGLNVAGGVSYRAIAYHPRARSESGAEISGGGFFCAAK